MTSDVSQEISIWNDRNQMEIDETSGHGWEIDSLLKLVFDLDSQVAQMVEVVDQIEET